MFIMLYLTTNTRCVILIFCYSNLFILIISVPYSNWGPCTTLADRHTYHIATPLLPSNNMEGPSLRRIIYCTSIWDVINQRNNWTSGPEGFTLELQRNLFFAYCHETVSEAALFFQKGQGKIKFHFLRNPNITKFFAKVFSFLNSDAIPPIDSC